MKLEFKPHPILSELKMAKHNGYSIVKGSPALLDANYEVMDPDGNIHKANSMDDVFRILKG